MFHPFIHPVDNYGTLPCTGFLRYDLLFYVLGKRGEETKIKKLTA